MATSTTSSNPRVHLTLAGASSSSSNANANANASTSTSTTNSSSPTSPNGHGPSEVFHHHQGHRPQPAPPLTTPLLRTSSSSSSTTFSLALAPSAVSSRVPTPRHSPLLPSASPSPSSPLSTPGLGGSGGFGGSGSLTPGGGGGGPYAGYPPDKHPSMFVDSQQSLLSSHSRSHSPNLGHKQMNHHHPQQLQAPLQHQPSICGLPLKYVSLVTLAVQNAALSIVMHYSRVSTPPSLAYSPASAVLLNELLKGLISFIIAYLRSPHFSFNSPSSSSHPLTRIRVPRSRKRSPFLSFPLLCYTAFTSLCSEIFSVDAWKLSIPAILYVIQNSLQFVAISNLPVASFQVTYQMKILTTAAFSVALLRKKLTGVKWLALLFLALGVGIVQIQPGAGGAGVKKHQAVGSAHEWSHVMSPMKGFGAVTAACFTSGLAGVYFEMVLKGSKADLWVRNVQLSLFSLIPALLPILYSSSSSSGSSPSEGILTSLFRHFGWWAWATVSIQVFGGLVTAVVIKYSDNILKGFATSLSIVLSFLASVVLFGFRVTPSFVIGAGVVLGATWMYNSPAAGSSGGGGMGGGGMPVAAAEKEREKEELEWERERERERGVFELVLNNPSPTSTNSNSVSGSGKSSPSMSPYYPGTPALSNPNSNSGLGLGGNGGADGGNGSILGLGVGSFMRRKSGGFSRSASNANFHANSNANLGLGGGLGGNGNGNGGLGNGGLGGGLLGLASRNSSTTSLSGLLSASLNSLTASASASSSSANLLPVSSTSGAAGALPGNTKQGQTPGSLGLAESGEVVHPEGGFGFGGDAGTPWSSRPVSRIPSRTGSPAPGPRPPFLGKFGRRES